MANFKVYLREIRVVPVIIQADSKEQAEEQVREGNGDYDNAAAVHSDLNADEYFDSLFELPTIQLPD